MPNTYKVPQREETKFEIWKILSKKKKYKEGTLFLLARTVTKASLEGTKLDPRNTKGEDGMIS